jgi:Ohr subfamily peroxiredoxin
MIYLTRTATVKGGRNGTITTPNQSLHLQMAKPVEMGGKESQNTNPEELFVAGYVGCLASSLEFIAGQMSLSYEALEVTGAIDLQDSALGGFEFALNVTFNMAGVDTATKATLVEKTLAFCPFSRAIKDNVKVTSTIL